MVDKSARPLIVCTSQNTTDNTVYLTCILMDPSRCGPVRSGSSHRTHLDDSPRLHIISVVAEAVLFHRRSRYSRTRRRQPLLSHSDPCPELAILATASCQVQNINPTRQQQLCPSSAPGRKRSTFGPQNIDLDSFLVLRMDPQGSMQFGSCTPLGTRLMGPRSG